MTSQHCRPPPLLLLGALTSRGLRQGPGSALARNAELLWTICAKRACREQLRHTRESVVVHQMAAPVTWRVDMTHDSAGTHGPSQDQSGVRAPGRRSAALAQGIPEHTSRQARTPAMCLAGRLPGKMAGSAHTGLPGLSPSLLCAPFGTAWLDSQCSMYPWPNASTPGLLAK